jgi:hypothetical protein
VGALKGFMQKSSIEKIPNNSVTVAEEMFLYIAGIEGQILAQMRETGKPIVLETVYRSDGSVEGVKISLCPL